MSKKQAGSVLHYLNQLIGTPKESPDSDAQLLDRFAGRRDQAAFAELVRRYGRLVWNVCRRLLRHDQDAEDAFQATFVILADKAASIRKRRSLASWLYGVAARTAWNARKKVRRRRYHEQHAEQRAYESPVNTASLRELQTILEEEVRRLPEKYQAPFVLCCLEGKGRAEAARLLGWKEGTVSSRLALARERLQKRLARRGVALSAALCAAALSSDSASAAVPVALGVAAAKITAGAISDRAMVLANGVMRSMMAARLKAGAALVLIVGSLTAGGVTILQQIGANSQPQPPREVASNPAEQQRGNTDLHGDPLPPGVVARLGTIRFRAGGCIHKLAFSPDGKTIASSSDDNVFRLWDAASGKIIREITDPDSSIPFSLAFSPKGKILAALERFFDVETGKEIGRLNPSILPAGDVPTPAFCSAFSPDGKYFATGDHRTARLWDVASGKQVRKFDVCRNNECNGVPCLAFSPDGKTLATGARLQEHSLRLWDVASGKERYGVCGNHKDEGAKRTIGGVEALAFSPDGKTLATAGAYDTAVRLWDAATGRELRQLHGHIAAPDALAFSPDGKQLVTGSGLENYGFAEKEHSARVWDVASGRELYHLQGHHAAVKSVAFSPDGKTIATGGQDSCVLLWGARDGKPAGFRSGAEGAVHSIAIASDGKTVVTRTGKAITVWETASGKEVRRMPGGLGGIALAPDGRRLASAETDGAIRLWDVATGREIQQLRGHQGNVNSVAFSPDGKHLVSGGLDATTRLWDLADGKERHRMIGRQPGLPPKPIPGRSIPVVYAGNTSFVSCVVFSPDGKTIASGYCDNTVRLWEVATGKQIQQLAEQGCVTAVAFSPDGRLLASAGGFDNKVRLWEIASGKVHQEIVHYKRVLALAFSPDGRTLASSSWDQSCGDPAETDLWDVCTGKLWGRLRGHRGSVVSLAYSLDGKRLATGSADTSVLWWDMSDLTPERRRHMLSLPASELEELWNALWSLNGENADPGVTRAACRLSTVPEQSVPFLAQRLLPKVRDMQTVRQWVAELDSADFEVANLAFRNLQKLGEAAKPALREVEKNKHTFHAEGWIPFLLHCPASPDEMRALRAVEVLRLIDNDQSRALLKKLVGGVPSAPLTQAAAAALKSGTR